MAVTVRGDANSRFLGLVSGGSTIIRSNGIETVCHQKNPSNEVKHKTHMKSGKCTNIKKTCKNNMASLRSKNEIIVLRIIYNNKNVPTLAARGGNGSSVKI